MSENVIGLHGNVPAGAPVPGVVEQLEHLLARAKRGEIRAVAVAAIDDSGTAISNWHHQGLYFQLLGASSWLHNRMLNE